MKLVQRNTLSAADKESILNIWNSVYPEKLVLNGMHDLDAYLDPLIDKNHFLLVNNLQQVLAWAASFTRDDERWFVIILDSSIQKQGYGKQLLNELKNSEQELCSWVTDHSRDTKPDGNYYMSPLDFYLKNGFTLLPDCRLELEKISAVKIQWRKDAL